MTWDTKIINHSSRLATANDQEINPSQELLLPYTQYGIYINVAGVGQIQVSSWLQLNIKRGMGILPVHRLLACSTI
jgi:hypothetical protein